PQRIREILEPALLHLGRDPQQRHDLGERAPALRCRAESELEAPAFEARIDACDLRAFDPVREPIPPRREAILDESGGEIEGAARAVPLEQRQRAGDVVAIAVIEAER